jgi:hypothetical protein
MDKGWIECWLLTLLCVGLAIMGWFGNDPEMTGYAIAGAILLPGYKWYYSKD